MEESVRVAHSRDAGVVAQLLDDFNREYDTPSPGVAVLTARLGQLLGGGEVFAVLGGDPAYGVGLLTLRPNVWYAGPVGLLDELYIVPHRRRQGLGTALLHAAEEVVRGRGGEVLEINVDEGDADARRFYERHGYRNSEPGKDEQLLYYFRELQHVSGSSALP